MGFRGGGWVLRVLLGLRLEWSCVAVIYSMVPIGVIDCFRLRSVFVYWWSVFLVERFGV